MRALWLPQALDRFDVKWEPVHGWQTRGSDTFDPRGGVDHHTAGGSVGNCPSLGIVTNGRAGLPGPLSQTLQGRDNTVYIVASGRANHAGLGGWKGLVGNTRVWGNERENVGTQNEPWRADQHDTAARLHAAWLWGMAEFEGVNVPSFMVCEHKEWAPTRKVDIHSFPGSQLRDDIAAVLIGRNPSPTPAPLPKEEEDNMNLPAVIVKGDDPADPKWYVTDRITRQWIQNRAHAAILISGGDVTAQAGTGDMTKTAEIVPFTWPAVAVRSIRLVE